MSSQMPIVLFLFFDLLCPDSGYCFPLSFFLVPALIHASTMSTTNHVVPPVNDAVVHPSQEILAVSLSIDQRKEAWRLKHRNVSAGTTAYWAMRAAERDAIFTYDSQTVSDQSSFSDDDSEDDVALTHEEHLLRDYNARRDAFFSHPLAVWNAMYDLHGWTKRVQRDWKSANTGLGRHTYPWRILTHGSENPSFLTGLSTLLSCPGILLKQTQFFVSSPALLVVCSGNCSH
jgi:hypothetical protein